jgi:DNA-binding SARP family transcriptional activator
MQFEILGPLRVIDAHSGTVKVTGQRRRILLVALLAHPNSAVATADLVDWLWPRQPPRSAQATLQAHVSALRRVLEPARAPWQPGERLLTHPTGYQLRVEADELDALRFERLVAAAKPALDTGALLGGYRLATEALALWHGPALADAADVDAARGVITRLEELYLTAATVRFEACLAMGRHLEAVPELTRLVATHPLHEPFYVLLMIALSRSNRRAEALAVYRRARRVLAREVRVEPGRALRRAEAALLSGELEEGWPA